MVLGWEERCGSWSNTTSVSFTQPPTELKENTSAAEASDSMRRASRDEPRLGSYPPTNEVRTRSQSRETLQVSFGGGTHLADRLEIVLETLRERCHPERAKRVPEGVLALLVGHLESGERKVE
jgi:hypothetical protein